MPVSRWCSRLPKMHERYLSAGTPSSSPLWFIWETVNPARDKVWDDAMFITTCFPFWKHSRCCKSFSKRFVGCPQRAGIEAEVTGSRLSWGYLFLWTVQYFPFPVTNLLHLLPSLVLAMHLTFLAAFFFAISFTSFPYPKLFTLYYLSVQFYKA